MHSWKSVDAHDNDDNHYEAYLCENCSYLVVAYPRVSKVEHHPHHRLVLLPQNHMTEADAVKVCKDLNIDCEG